VGWDDFKGADLRGKIALFLINDPDSESWATVLSSRGGPQFDLNRSSPPESQTLLRGWLRRDAAAELFREAKLDLEELKRRARQAEFAPQELPGARLSVRMQLRVTPVLSHNVIARLRGRERPDESVVYGAHWDHLGLGAPDTTCDLSIRGTPNSSLHYAAAAIAMAQGRVLAPDAHPEAGYFYRADHFPLAKRGVPGISIMPGLDLFDGLARGQKAYEDYIAHRYHRPADRWSPDWDLRGAALDAEILYRLGRDIAESSQWPQWRQDAEFKHIRDRSAVTLHRTVTI
jgi:Zn-dependent M28 family amino/carboxypeptidase